MKSRNDKTKTADAILKLAKNTDNLPTPLLVQSLNGTIQILTRRGIKIRDWDDRDKTVHGFRVLGNQVFLLAPGKAQKTEVDADGKNEKSGHQ